MAFSLETIYYWGPKSVLWTEQGLAGGALPKPLAVLEQQNTIKTWAILLSTLSRATSYTKAFLLSGSILLGNNNWNLSWRQEKVFVLFPKLGDQSYIFPVFLIAHSLHLRMFLSRLVRLKKRIKIQIFTTAVGFLKVLGTGQKYWNKINAKVKTQAKSKTSRRAIILICRKTVYCHSYIMHERLVCRPYFR